MRNPTPPPNVRDPYPPPADVAERVAAESEGVLLGLMIPLLMMVLNLVMFLVALPTIRDDFALSADVSAWLVTAYTLPLMMFMPAYGRLGDALGKRRLLMAGLTLFFIGTVLALFSPNLATLMLARMLQGMGAASINPLCIAIISQLFPAGQRGKNLGAWNSVGPISAIPGPFVAGFLVGTFGWRTIFIPVLIASLVAFYVVYRRVPSLSTKADPNFWRTFDWGGLLLLGSATVTLVFYASSRPITGVAPLQDWRLLAITILLFAAFFIWERRQADPFVHLSIFRIENFGWASFGSGLRMFVMSGGLGFLMPLYLADVRHFGAEAIGLMLMIHAVAMVPMMRMGGQLADRWSGRWPVIIGSTGQTMAMLHFALLPQSAWVGWLVVGLIGHGLSAGLTLPALHRASMSQIPDAETGGAAGLYSMLRFTGTVLGIALCGVVLQQGLDWSLPVTAAYQMVFGFITAIALLSVGVNWQLRG